MMPWYWVDLLIIGVIALSVITGLIRGFVKELVALGIWILSIWAAWNYSDALDPLLQSWIQDKSARVVASSILILIATLIAGGLVNALLSAVMKRSGLSGTDRILGMGFGFVRGVFIISLVMVAIKLTSLPYNDYAKDSRLYARFDPIVNWLDGKMPDFIKQASVLEQAPVKMPDSGSEHKKVAAANIKSMVDSSMSIEPELLEP